MRRLLLSILALLPSCFSLREREQLELPGRIMGQYIIWGAASGALLTTTLNLTDFRGRGRDEFSWVILCDDDEFGAVLNSPDDVCAPSYTPPARNYKRMGSPYARDNATLDWSLSLTTSSASLWHYLFFSCTDSDMSFALELHFVNPGGEELSTGEIPYKLLSLGFAAAWGAVAALLAASMAAARCAWRPQPPRRAPGAPPPPSPVRALHWALLAVPLLAAGNAYAVRAYYVAASASGEFSAGLGYGAMVAGDAEAVALLAVILLLSRGWQVTRLSLDVNETRYVAFVALVYLTVNLVFQLIGGLFFMFLLILTYVLMLRYVFASVSWKLRLLSAFRAYSQSWASGGGGGGGAGAGGGGGGGGAGGAGGGGGGAAAQVSEREALSAGRDGLLAPDGDALLFGDAPGGGGGYYDEVPPSPPVASAIYVAETVVAPRRAQLDPRCTIAVREDAEEEEGAAARAAAAAVAEPPPEVPPPPPPAAALAAASLPEAALPPPPPPLPLFQSAWAGRRELSPPPPPRAVTFSSAAVGAQERQELIADPPEAAPASPPPPPPPASLARRVTAAVSRGLALLGDPSQVPDGTLTSRQMVALRYFRFAIVAYLVLSSLIQLWSVLTATNFPWVSFLATELMNALMVCYLFFLFNPSKGVLFDAEGYVDRLYEPLLERGGAPGEARSRSPPAAAAAAAAAAAPPLLVIQNPEGSTTASFAVGQLLRSPRANA